jgi:hypothetical protein
MHIYNTGWIFPFLYGFYVSHGVFMDQGQHDALIGSRHNITDSTTVSISIYLGECPPSRHQGLGGTNTADPVSFPFILLLHEETEGAGVGSP